jgi:chemotaxis-related protein WspD
MLDVPSAKPHSTCSAIDDCWNRIGVRGDGSCPELKLHAHCRNCPTYSAAALRLLDRDLSAQCVADSTGHFAQVKQLEEQDTHSVVIFRLASEWFALPTLVFDEVSEQRMIHSLPHRRSVAVLGLVNVRGELLICASLGRMLALEETAAAPACGIVRKRLVIMRHEGGRIAFPVDEVQGTYRYHLRELRPVPATLAKSAATYTKALLSWRERTVGCLDADLIVHTLNRSVA